MGRGIACVVAAGALAAPTVVSAQRADTTRATQGIRPLATVPPDSLKAPIGPTRAFLYSFLVPGSAQSMLGRHKAAATFLMIEAICIAMIRESAADVHEARRIANDTLVISYVGPSGTGPAITAPPRFTSQEIQTREAHVEDWAALMVGNHLFAGADAFVSSHLWDVPIHVGMRATPAGGHAFTIGVALQR